MTMIPNSDYSKRFEKMPVEIYKNSVEASKKIADVIIETINSTPADKKCVICLDATSASIPVYERLIEAYKDKKVSFKNVVAFSKSEYYPLNRNELQSQYRFLKEYVFDNVDILPTNIRCLDSSQKENIRAYCDSYEKEIENAGGIDIMLTGNAGFNQSGTQ